jgi:hypothetical protein
LKVINQSEIESVKLVVISKWRVFKPQYGWAHHGRKENQRTGSKAFKHQIRKFSAETKNEDQKYP